MGRQPHLPFSVLSRLTAALALGLTAACAQFPEVDAFPPAATDTPPTLLPLDQLLSQAAAPAVAQPAGTALAARAAQLKARAAGMHDAPTPAPLGTAGGDS